MITAEILGVDRVLSWYQSMPSSARGVMAKRVAILGIMLRDYVKANKLTGEVLHVRTGRLRRSITSRTTSEGGTFTGIVGTNVEYGAAWELGFDRKVGAGARGGPRTMRSAMALENYRRRHPAGTRHYMARSFLQSALADKGGEIRQGLYSAMNEALKGVK